MTHFAYIVVALYLGAMYAFAAGAPAVVFAVPVGVLATALIVAAVIDLRSR